MDLLFTNHIIYPVLTPHYHTGLCVIIDWRWERVNQDVTSSAVAASDGGQTERGQTRCLRGVTLTLARSGQSQVSPGSPVTTRMGPPFLWGVAWPPDDPGHDITDNAVSPFVPASPIWADDQYCDDRCRGTWDASGDVTAWFPRPVQAMHGSDQGTVCLNGLTPRLVTTNTGGLSVVTAISCHRKQRNRSPLCIHYNF